VFLLPTHVFLHYDMFSQGSGVLILHWRCCEVGELFILDGVGHDDCSQIGESQHELKFISQMLLEDKQTHSVCITIPDVVQFLCPVSNFGLGTEAM